MARKKITFDTVRKIGLRLPDVEEGTMYGTPALKIRGKLLTCIPSHKSAEPDSLAIRMDFDQRDALLAEDPAAYYLKDHYTGYPVILARFARLSEETLRDLLNVGWRFVTSEKRRPAAVQRKRRD